MMRISNRDARRLWLANHLLLGPPTGPLNVMEVIRRLGFVQLDTIRNVTRAHHHILWSRNQNYREKLLWPLLKNRALFEHYTHDASLIPMDYLPMWQRQFQKMGDYYARSDWGGTSLGKQQIAQIKARIVTEGPLSTHAFDTKIEGEKAMWARPPHKKALDQMWYAGELATSYRKKFVKYYDIAERVFPAGLQAKHHSDSEQIAWLCKTALGRLGFASPTDVARFWDAVKLPEARAWGANTATVLIEAADGSDTKVLAAPDLEQRLADLGEPSNRLRILNPFDPAIRDRQRLERLFGFEYRNEMFVPKDQRRWGYYVYPLLEGLRFVGRLELKADRKTNRLNVTGFWPEPGVDWATARQNRLESELLRFARFAGLSLAGTVAH